MFFTDDFIQASKFNFFCYKKLAKVGFLFDDKKSANGFLLLLLVLEKF